MYLKKMVILSFKRSWLMRPAHFVMDKQHQTTEYVAYDIERRAFRRTFRLEAQTRKRREIEEYSCYKHVYDVGRVLCDPSEL